MRVAVDREKEIDCYEGDVILFDEVPCMVIDLGNDSDYYGVLALEGNNAGKVINTFEALSDIDTDERVTEVLIKCPEVVISKED